MPFQVLRRKADMTEIEACGTCRTTDLQLYHFTNQGGIKDAHTSHGYDPKYLSKVMDFSEQAFCSFSCFELALSKREAPIPKACLPKRPF